MNQDKTVRNTLQGIAYADIKFLEDFTFTLKGDLNVRNSETAPIIMLLLEMVKVVLVVLNVISIVIRTILSNNSYAGTMLSENICWMC